MSSDQILYDCIQDLLKKSIELLSDKLNCFKELNEKFEQLPIEYPAILYTDENQIKKYLFIKDYVKRLILIIEESLKDDIESCIRIIQLYHKTSTQLSHGKIVMNMLQNQVDSKNFLFHILEAMIIDYLRCNKINTPKLKSLCDDMKKFFYDDEIEITILSPLQGFESPESDELYISKSISIRKISMEEKIFLFDKNISDEFLPYNTNWILQYKIKVRKDIENDAYFRLVDSKLTDNIFATVITALRLFQFGDFGTNSFVGFVSLDVPINLVNISNLKIMGFGSAPFGRYIFYKKNLPEFIRFLNQYDSLLSKILNHRIEGKEDSFIQIKNAIRRFNLSYQRYNESDVIIDKLIALESLLSKKDENELMTFRLSLRAAKLLKSTIGERKDCYKDIKEIYNIRSKIVHGDLEGHYHGKNARIIGMNLITTHAIVSSIILSYMDHLNNNDDFNHLDLIERLDFE